MNTFEVQIPIHPPGKRTTNNLKAAELKQDNPKAFKTAQDLLVAAEKLLYKKGGFFTSDKKRMKNVVEALDQLYKDLMIDPDYSSRRSKGKAWILIIYLSNVSEAFPNWQDVYMFLNEIIPEIHK